METHVLSHSEYALTRLVWETQPADLSDLIWSCFVRFGWKKSIAAAAIRSLCNQGVFRNEKSGITLIVRHEDIIALDQDDISVKAAGRPQSRLFNVLRRHPKIKNILNFTKPYPWLIIGVIISTMVCVSIPAQNHIESKDDEVINPSLFSLSISDEKIEALNHKLVDILPPDNLCKSDIFFWGDESGIMSVFINFSVYARDDTIPPEVFDIVQSDLNYLTETASTIYSRIDGVYSVNFSISGNEHYANIDYIKDPAANKLKKRIYIVNNEPIYSEVSTESTYTVEVASGETIVISNSW